MDELSSLGETRIDEAIASGELKPPPSGTRLDLEAYFAAPEDWRSGYSMLKGQGFAPPEVERLRQAERLEEELKQATSAEERLRLRREIEEHRVSFRMAIERLNGR